jgi:YfiR/HmsC-like
MMILEQPDCSTRKRCARGQTQAWACWTRRIARVSLTLCLILAQTFRPSSAIAQGSAEEYEVKAAILYNFTRFVEWPPSAYSDAQAPTVLCILGRDPFGASLTSFAATQVGSARPVQIRHVQNGATIRLCHVLYISSSDRKNLAQIFSNLNGASVLTVGEMSQFAVRGGMIQFELSEKQVHFNINLDTALRADLRISARLLVLAKVVKDESTTSEVQTSKVGL